MTQQNKDASEAQLFPSKPGGKLDNTFPDGVGKSGGTEASKTSDQEYSYSEKMAGHTAEIADHALATAHYGGHGVVAREVERQLQPPDTDHDMDYDTNFSQPPGTNAK